MRKKGWQEGRIFAYLQSSFLWVRKREVESWHDEWWRRGEGAVSDAWSGEICLQLIVDEWKRVKDMEGASEQ